MNTARRDGCSKKKIMVSRKASRMKRRGRATLQMESLEGRHVFSGGGLAVLERALPVPVVGQVASDIPPQARGGINSSPKGLVGSVSHVILVAPRLQPATVPEAPTHLTATVRDGQVVLTWFAPKNDGGAPVTDYVIEFGRAEYACRVSEVPIDSKFLQRLQKLVGNRVPTEGNGMLRFAVPKTVMQSAIYETTIYKVFEDGMSAATSVSVAGLTPGQTYNFRVTATNSAGGSTSAWCSVTIPQSAAPAQGGSVRPQAAEAPQLLKGEGRSVDMTSRSQDTAAAYGCVNATAVERSKVQPTKHVVLSRPPQRSVTGAQGSASVPGSASRATHADLPAGNTAPGKSVTVVMSSPRVNNALKTFAGGRLGRLAR